MNDSKISGESNNMPICFCMLFYDNLSRLGSKKEEKTDGLLSLVLMWQS